MIHYLTIVGDQIVFPLCVRVTMMVMLQSYEVDNEVLDEFIVKDHPTPCNELYGECFDMIANPFFDCKESLENPRLVLDIYMDGICDCKSNCAFECQPVTHEEIEIQGMCDPLHQFEYETFIFKVDSMHKSGIEEGY